MILIDSRDKKRFKSSFHKDPSGCWLWDRGIRRGYGCFVIKRKKYGAHRISFILHKGPIPFGKMVLHSCDVRSCVRPSHLFLGTGLDNVRDCVSKNRHAHGETGGKCKLTEAQVIDILTCSEDGVSVANRYGITVSAVHLIRSRKNWKHIPMPPHSVTIKKLTDTDVSSIRKDGRAAIQIAADYGVSRSYISNIKNGWVKRGVPLF